MVASVLIAIPPAGLARAAEPVAAYTITDGSEIADSLTGAPGDAARGRALYAQEPRACCPDCHCIPGQPAGESPAMRTEGPDLAGVGIRLSAGAMRLWIIAPSALEEETEMPFFYGAGQRLGAGDPLYGGPARTAAEVEDLVAYLGSLR